jgi:type I restriction enzyme, S subunit
VPRHAATYLFEVHVLPVDDGVTDQTAYSDVQMPDKYRIGTGDILFSWSGNPETSIDTFVWPHEPAWLNQHIFRVLPHVAGERAFILQLLRHLKPVFTQLARNKQTTGLGHVTVADLKRLIVAKPDPLLLAAFDSVAGTIQQRIFQNQCHAQTVAALRDSLLPRLISGQLRLDEPAEALEPA